MLRVLNRAPAADFDPDAFLQRAEYNAALEQIEICLTVGGGQRIDPGELDAQLHISPGEKILSEISRKFTPAGIDTLLGAAGTRLAAHLEPDNACFSRVYATPEQVVRAFNGGVIHHLSG